MGAGDTAVTKTKAAMGPGDAMNDRSAGKARALRSESTADVATATVSNNTMSVTSTAAQGPADTEATGRDGQMNETKFKEGQQAVQILTERSKKLEEQTGNVYHQIQRLE